MTRSGGVDLDVGVGALGADDVVGVGVSDGDGLGVALGEEEAEGLGEGLAAVWASRPSRRMSRPITETPTTAVTAIVPAATAVRRRVCRRSPNCRM